MLRLFPLILLVVIFYNFLALGSGAIHYFDPKAGDLASFLQDGISITLYSGKWSFTVADLLTLVTLVLLFVEIIKATRTTANEIINHALSMLTFVIALLEFVLVKGFATSTFFFVMAMSLFDVIAGYTISIVAAEHDLGLGRAGTD